MSTHPHTSIVNASLAGMPKGVKGFLKNIATEVYSVPAGSNMTFVKKVANEVYDHKDASKLSADFTK